MLLSPFGRSDAAGRYLAAAYVFVRRVSFAAPARVFGRCPLDGGGKLIGWLRAGDRECPAENEAGHAIDAGLAGGFRLPLDAHDIGVAVEPFPNFGAIKAAIDGRLHEHGAVREIAPLGEIEVHQTLLHPRGITALARPEDQPMAVERVRLACDPVDRVEEPLRGRRRSDAAGNSVVALDGPEFCLQVFFPADAAARNPRVEKIGAPAHLHRNLGPDGERLFQPALADEAPGTDDVGDNVDRHDGGNRIHDSLLALGRTAYIMIPKRWIPPFEGWCSFESAPPFVPGPPLFGTPEWPHFERLDLNP